MKNCSINYQCNKCKGKHNITICKGPRKPDPNAKKDCNPAPIIQDIETLTTLTESRHSTLLQTAYSRFSFQNKIKKDFQEQSDLVWKHSFRVGLQ